MPWVPTNISSEKILDKKVGQSVRFHERSHEIYVFADIVFEFGIKTPPWSVVFECSERNKPTPLFFSTAICLLLNKKDIALIIAIDLKFDAHSCNILFDCLI